MLHRLVWLLLILCLPACRPGTSPNLVERPVDRVDPRIGTGAGTTPSALRHSEADNEPRGQTVPSVGVPHGMTSWTPQTRATEQKCLAPYYAGDERIQGFRGSHWMSGSCTQDYGSVTLMPMTGTPVADPEARSSAFEQETATPAYYAVTLSDTDIRAEMTATNRAGVLRFTFYGPGPAFIVIEPNSDEGVGTVQIDPERQMVVGSNPVHRIYQGWGEPAGFSGHFAAVFDRPFAGFGVWRGTQRRDGVTSATGDSSAVRAYVRFDLAPGEVVHVRVGTSFTGIDGARRNLEAEVPDVDFERTRRQAEAAWNSLLGRAQVSGGPAGADTLFYTALYHALLLPRTFSDADGTYPRFAGGAALERASGFTYYADFSVWDTFRAVHPLLILLAPDAALDMARSLVAKGRQGGWLPIFPAWNSYTSAMIGDHVFSIIADAYLKGLTDFDAEAAYALMRQNATTSPDSADYLDGKGRRALASYLRHGYVPLDDPVRESFHQQEQVSRTLEYAYDDFALGQLAAALGKPADARRFWDRAGNYRHVFDPTVGFVRGRYADGSWAEPFDPAERAPYITEGSPWHYTWYVPHDVQGLIHLMGGREAFVARLDTLFETGLYWHGNEPGHHIPYLYAYAGAPWKTQQRVREIMAAEYGPGPGGLSGNDDAGQMSAWYVFSAIGLYPVSPGWPYYVLGSPLFETTRLDVGDGKTFTIRAEHVSEENRFIQAATLNGRRYDRPWLDHGVLTAGGELILTMGPQPNPAWGADPALAPPTMTLVGSVP
ncbi:alpha-mannosidase [Rhodothermaceae bacterium RA]|nr:alpha-mannosidase [Rhodothermaceae bacterium RA]